MQKKGPPPGRNFIPGDRVRLAGSGADGKVVELRESRVVVETAGVRIQLPAADLVFVGSALDQETGGRKKEPSLASSWEGPEAEPQSECDLRGMRVVEVDVQLDRAVDQAVMGGLGEIRIIHGKGTGALRQRVTELLAKDQRVQEFRMGQPGEGGAGVTMVKFR